MVKSWVKSAVVGDGDQADKGALGAWVGRKEEERKALRTIRVFCFVLLQRGVASVKPS